jgi:hypothetical protein
VIKVKPPRVAASEDGAERVSNSQVLIFFENFAAQFPEKEIGQRRLRDKKRVASVLALVLA